MGRTITVKGIGQATAKPDYVVLSMVLQSLHEDYEQAMSIASDKIEQINDALAVIGFENDDLKTTSFNVHTEYERAKNDNGEYISVFKGYSVTHNLKLSFDFDTQTLAKAISALGSCNAHPQLSIAFTVKDTTAINEEMLRSATINAKRKAEILCEASGVELCDLVSIDYSWGELDVYSHTSFSCCDETLSASTARAINIQPDDIQTSDTATFVWNIK